MGVAVPVVRTDRDDRDRSAHPRDEPGIGRAGTVVGDLEHPRTQIQATSQHLRLSGLLRVASQQDAVSTPADPDHE